MSGKLTSIAKASPPHKSDDGRHRAQIETATAASTAAQEIVGLTENGGEQYVTFVALGGVAHIVFGASDVDAATTSDFPLPADQPMQFSVKPATENYIRCIRGTNESADVPVHYYISER